MSKLIVSAVFAAVLAACGGGYGYQYGVSASVATPNNLVEVSPGVYAVQGYDEPLFYANNSYWLYQDGAWYRSPYYTGGWSYVQQPPRVILGIQRPYAWVHGRYNAYNGRNYRQYNRYNRYNRNNGNVRVLRPPHPIGR